MHSVKYSVLVEYKIVQVFRNNLLLHLLLMMNDGIFTDRTKSDIF